jgi:VWFA-related protein
MSAQGNMRRFFQSIFLCLLTLSVSFAQTSQNPQNQRAQDEVVRVFTELVQTDVMVFDKEGKFVNGLTQNDFQLKVDGKIKPIQAFELIKAGSNEEAQLAAARGTAVNLDPGKPNRPVPLDRGRTVFFYLDDFHLDLAGFVAAKKAISSFIGKQMGQNDQIAITTATGQIGFLQQLTNNKTVLLEAVERLKPRNYTVRDAERPQMKEYEALLIDNYDRDVTAFFVTETLRNNPGLPVQAATNMVQSRAQSILTQAGAFTTRTLGGLENWVRSIADLPGRKVVFLLSNGFFVENRRSDTTSRMRQIINSAAKSGVVIYAMDTRGLVADLNDISIDRPFDPSGRLQRAASGELSATQDGMNALARDTGGRAIFNTNDLNAGLVKAVKETSVYYLLAWKPDSDADKPGRFRNVEVSVLGRTDLSVRVRRGSFDLDRPTSRAEENKLKANKTTPARLRDAIVASHPQRALPLSLDALYYDVINKGPTITASVQIPGEFMTFGPQDGQIQAIVDLSGVFYNDRGVPVKSFLDRIVTTAPNAEAAKAADRDIVYSHAANLEPGLYQVRVAGRDEKSGVIGSAHAWIKVPDLSKKELATSSLVVGERSQAASNTPNAGALTPISLSPSHLFRSQSFLRFLVFTYNAAPSPADGKPDVAIQVQVLRDDQPVVTTALRKVSTEGVADVTRLPYAAEIPLTGLATGQYVLRVTVIDKLSKKSISQQTHFEVY